MDIFPSQIKEMEVFAPCRLRNASAWPSSDSYTIWVLFEFELYKPEQQPSFLQSSFQS